MPPHNHVEKILVQIKGATAYPTMLMRRVTLLMHWLALDLLQKSLTAHPQPLPALWEGGGVLSYF